MFPTSRFLSFLSQHQLFNPDNKALLAVSGGRDSVLMVKLFNEAGLHFGIAHCNFGLRAAESEADEQFVEELAKNSGVPFYTVKFDTKAFAEEHRISIQMAARELRYEWLEAVRKQNNYECIALAHHASDVTETVLLNLTRGTGIAGLHGILPKRGNFIRPLLFLRRDEISEIISIENIPFREDSSNLSSKYARNKIRLEVIPKLKELNQQLDETFEKNSRRFGQLEEFLNRQVEGLRSQLFKSAEDGRLEIELLSLQQLAPLELLMFELFKPYNFSETVLNDLIASWHGQPGKVFESRTHLIVLDRGKLLVEEKNANKLKDLLWDKGISDLSYNKHAFKASISDISTIVIDKNSNKAFFDENLLQYPLKLRQWNEGDYFFPFGMKGRKKLSDFLRELKIPVTQKKRTLLLVNGNGDVLWVIGYRTDNRYKVSPDTKKVITFEKTREV